MRSRRRTESRNARFLALIIVILAFCGCAPTITQRSILGHDIVTSDYNGWQPRMHDIYKGGQLVGRTDDYGLLSWKENEMLRIIADPNTPEPTRQAMTIQYEQDQANLRAAASLAAAQSQARMQYWTQHQMQQQYQMQQAQARTQQSIANMGSSLGNWNRNKTSCTTNYLGSTAYTDCN